jgi:polyphenol oxidase
MKKSSTRRYPGASAVRGGSKPAAGWKFDQSGGLTILRASTLARLPWLLHGFSTRPGGESSLGGKRVLNLGNTEWDTPKNVEQNRTQFLAALGATTMQLTSLQQCHTDILHVVRKPPAESLRGDALLCATPGLLLAVKTADCVPILLADTKRRAVASVHAGWRGTLARIVEKALGRMQMEFGTKPNDVIAVLGPAIGRCCYEVGAEVAQAFAAQFEPAREWFDGPFDKVTSDDSPNPLRWLQMTPPGHDLPPPHVNLDLHAANRWQLERAGVPARNIFASDLCTACRTDLLFSHRREQGKTGRMMGVIGIRS